MMLRWTTLLDPAVWGLFIIGLFLWLVVLRLPSSVWWNAVRRPIRVGALLLIVYAVGAEIARLLGVTALPGNIGALLWRLVLVAVGVYFVWEALNGAFIVVRQRIEKRIPEPERKARLITVTELAGWTARLFVLIVGLGMGLSVLGIDITPLVASVGIAGLALSLGAQQLVQDVIAGIFILIEDQFHVGDSVAINGIAGTVEGFSLRTTRVRDLNGTLHFIPNSQIRILSNRTAAWSRAVVDVGVSYGSDLDHVTRVLENVAEQLAVEDPQQEMFIERPQVLGPESFGDSSIGFRLIARVQPGKQWEAQRLMRRRIKAAFDQEGIEIPFPQVDVHLKNGGRTPDTAA